MWFVYPRNFIFIPELFLKPINLWLYVFSSSYNISIDKNYHITRIKTNNLEETNSISLLLSVEATKKKYTRKVKEIAFRAWIVFEKILLPIYMLSMSVQICLQTDFNWIYLQGNKKNQFLKPHRAGIYDGSTENPCTNFV